MADDELSIGSGSQLNLDAPEIRIGQPLLGIVGQQILGAQLLANLLEGAVELRRGGSIVILAAGIMRQLNESVLAAGVAPGTGLDGHDDESVKNGFRLLGEAQRLL